MKTLKLTLHKKAFEVMVTGEKSAEYRKPSKWILSRLKNKEYDAVEFVNGYSSKSPRFKVEYLGYTKAPWDFTKNYTNGLVVNVIEGDLIIHLGELINDTEA